MEPDQGPDSSTSMPHEPRSTSAWLASEPPEVVEAFLAGLSDEALAALPYIFDIWALPHQVPPEGDWRTWVILGGRGAGKTRAGAEWVRSMVEGGTPGVPGRARRVALIGETYDQALAVMVKGESGILACSPPDRRPRWVSGERMLVWSNGAEARLHSAHDPEALRGPQFDAAWVDEIGCGAVDKGTNQPNKFLDPKSSESTLPHFSNGRRDDLIQAQYLRATMAYWTNPANNPTSDQYDGPMIDVSKAHVWAWDARPWPAFPNDLARWSDGANHGRGHWITGRSAGQPLAMVVAEICESSGVTDYDVSRLFGFVRGHVSSDVETPRARLQPLMLAYGFGAVERDGKLVFQHLPDLPDAEIAEGDTAADEDGAAGMRLTRASEAETVGRVRVGFTEADGAFESRVAEAIFPDDADIGVSQSELPLALTQAEARGIAERWLSEARVARDTVAFDLPPSQRALGAGNMVAREDGSTWRIDRVEDVGARRVEAVRVEPSLSEASDATDAPVEQQAFVPPLPVQPMFMDLPLLTGDEVAHAPHLAVAARPWPGQVAVYSSSTNSGYKLNRLIQVGSVIGQLKTPLLAAKPGLWDRATPVRITTGSSGALSSTDLPGVLNGGNVAAIGAGDSGPWEIIQFANAEMVAPNEWVLSMLLRGQAGTDGVVPDVWPAGSFFVLLDGRPEQIELPSSARGLERYYRVGPAQRSLSDESYQERVLAFDGVGLRPYAPAHVRARRSGAGLEVSWIRRTRIDGDSWQGAEVPLGEDIEAYLIRVSDADGLKREVTVSTPNWTYSTAERTSDGTTPPFDIQVAQVSGRFGPGPFTRIMIDD